MQNVVFVFTMQIIYSSTTTKLDVVMNEYLDSFILRKGKHNNDLISTHIYVNILSNVLCWTSKSLEGLSFLASYCSAVCFD